MRAINVWDEVKRVYEIQLELNSLPGVQIHRGERQKRWMLEGERMRLLLSIDTDISLMEDFKVGNWFQRLLLYTALEMLSYPNAVKFVCKRVGRTRKIKKILKEEHEAEIGSEILQEIQSRMDRD